MSDGVKSLMSTVDISAIDLVSMPKDFMERYVNEKLATEIGHFIMENKDSLPMQCNSGHDRSNGSQRHVIKINLISTEELARLRAIEEEYNRMRWNK